MAYPIVELEVVEVFTEPDLEFAFSALFRRRGNSVEYAQTKQRGAAEVLQDRVKFTTVPPSELYPLFGEGIRVCSSSSTNNADFYIKRPSIVGYNETKGTSEMADQMLQEVKVMEFLDKHQHNNIVQYHGCLIEDGRIVGVALEKCISTLGDLMKQEDAMEHDMRAKCYNDIETAIKHLHSLGFAHNDLNPQNIMRGQDEAFKLIDFDSCAKNGAPISKTGTPDWNDGYEDHSAFENDEIGLRKLKIHLGIQM